MLDVVGYDDKLIYILDVVGHKVILWTRPRDRMLAITLELYQTGSGYTGRSPILLVCVTTKLQWTRIYLPLGTFLIFERYFPLMNALHVYWYLRRQQISLILNYATSDRMVSPTCIMLTLPFFILLLLGTVFRTSYVKVWQSISPVDGGSPDSLVEVSIIRLHKASLMFTNAFWYPPPGVLLEDYPYFIFLNASASSLILV